MIEIHIFTRESTIGEYKWSYYEQHFFILIDRDHYISDFYGNTEEDRAYAILSIRNTALYGAPGDEEGFI